MCVFQFLTSKIPLIETFSYPLNSHELYIFLDKTSANFNCKAGQHLMRRECLANYDNHLLKKNYDNQSLIKKA